MDSIWRIIILCVSFLFLIFKQFGNFKSWRPAIYLYYIKRVSFRKLFFLSHLLFWPTSSCSIMRRRRRYIRSLRMRDPRRSEIPSIDWALSGTYNRSSYGGDAAMASCGIRIAYSANPGRKIVGLYIFWPPSSIVLIFEIVEMFILFIIIKILNEEFISSFQLSDRFRVCSSFFLRISRPSSDSWNLSSYFVVVVVVLQLLPWSCCCCCYCCFPPPLQDYQRLDN